MAYDSSIMTAVSPEGISEGARISLKGKHIPLRVVTSSGARLKPKALKDLLKYFWSVGKVT